MNTPSYADLPEGDYFAFDRHGRIFRKVSATKYVSQTGLSYSKPDLGNYLVWPLETLFVRRKAS